MSKKIVNKKVINKQQSELPQVKIFSMEESEIAQVAFLSMVGWVLVHFIDYQLGLGIFDPLEDEVNESNSNENSEVSSNNSSEVSDVQEKQENQENIEPKKEEGLSYLAIALFVANVVITVITHF